MRSVTATKLLTKWLGAFVQLTLYFCFESLEETTWYSLVDKAISAVIQFSLFVLKIKALLGSHEAGPTRLLRNSPQVSGRCCWTWKRPASHHLEPPATSHLPPLSCWQRNPVQTWKLFNKSSFQMWVKKWKKRNCWNILKNRHQFLSPCLLLQDNVRVDISHPRIFWAIF